MTDIFDDLSHAYASYQTDRTFARARHLILLLRQHHRVDDAIGLIDRWADKTGSPIEAFQIAYDMVCLGMATQAESHLESVLPQLEGDASLYYQARLELAFVKYGLGRFHQAHPLQKSLHEPRWREAWAHLVSHDADSWFPLCAGKILHGQPVRGKTLLVLSEGGVGDLLQFFRYMANLRQEGAAAIYCYAPETVRGLLQASTSGVTVVSRVGDLIDRCDLVGWPSDLFVRYQPEPFVRTSHDYLRSKDNAPVPNALRLAGAPGRDLKTVGLVWRSSTVVRHEPFRSMTLDILEPLLEISHIAFYSLQVGELSTQERDIMTRHGVVDLGSHLRSFEDTAYVLDRLDLLISVDSGPAHLAATLGRPVWVMLAQACDYRWYDCQRYTPWYASMRLYRQAGLGEWEPVVEQLAASLARES
jgi:hypothetical protein